MRKLAATIGCAVASVALLLPGAPAAHADDASFVRDAKALGFVIALFYSGLWAMRTGIMSRLWASLGMAAGVAFLLGPLFVITLLWFVYFGLLVLGKVPGGRPPAWAAGEAIPWATPGEKAAAELEPEDPTDPPANGNGSGGSGDPGGERRKRKRRD